MASPAGDVIGSFVSELEQVRSENQALREELAVLRQQMDWLKKQLFGRKSERGRTEGQDELDLKLKEEGSGEASPPPAKKMASSHGGKMRMTRAQRLPDHLPVREEELLPLAVQAQPEASRRIGQEVTETLEKEPGYLYVRRVIRPKFV